MHRFLIDPYLQELPTRIAEALGTYVGSKIYNGYMHYRSGTYAHSNITKRKRSRVPTTRKRGRLMGPKLHYGYAGSETKFADSELIANLNTTWATRNPTTKDSLTSVAQGSGESTHLGRTMYMTSFHMKGEFVLAAAESGGAPQNDVVTRYVVVLDTDTKGTEVVAGDVMDTGQATDVYAFRNLQHTSRLKVLADKCFIMRPYVVNEGSPNLFAHGATRRKFQFNIKFKRPIRVLFSGTAAVVGDIVDNSLHFVCISNGGSAVSVDYQCRLRFKDTL